MIKFIKTIGKIFKTLFQKNEIRKLILKLILILLVAIGILTFILYVLH